MQVSIINIFNPNETVGQIAEVWLNGSQKNNKQINPI